VVASPYQPKTVSGIVWVPDDPPTGTNPAVRKAFLRSTGDICVCLCDDVILDAGWLQEPLSLLKSVDEIVAVGQPPPGRSWYCFGLRYANFPLFHRQTAQEHWQHFLPYTSQWGDPSFSLSVWETGGRVLQSSRHPIHFREHGPTHPESPLSNKRAIFEADFRLFLRDHRALAEEWCQINGHWPLSEDWLLANPGAFNYPSASPPQNSPSCCNRRMPKPNLDMAHDTLEKAYGLIEQYLRSTPRPVIIELGMCNGNHTGMLLNWVYRARYIGFEPDPRNVEKIKELGLHKMITFFAAAMGNITGPTTFHLATPNELGQIGCSSLSAFTPVLTQCWPWLKEQGTVTVPSIRMDDFCRLYDVKYIDFLWMDVQGGERLVFEGARQTIPNIGMIWTEYDGGTLYADSSTLADILKWFPGWNVLADCGGDVLLWNPDYMHQREALRPA
jgi:FkbM family methyltransferase